MTMTYVLKERANDPDHDSAKKQKCVFFYVNQCGTNEKKFSGAFPRIFLMYMYK